MYPSPVTFLPTFFWLFSFQFSTEDLIFCSLHLESYRNSLVTRRDHFRIFWEFFHASWNIWGENETNIGKTGKNSKFQFGFRQPLLTIFDLWSSCQLFSMASITRNHKNDSYYLENRHRDLQKIWMPLSFGQSLTSMCCCLSWIAAITTNHKRACHHSQN